jgi:glyoxalase family protein
MLNTTSFSVPAASLDYWQQRLQRFGIAFEGPKERLNSETVIYFTDPDGLGLELVFTDHDTRKGFTYGHIPLEYSIRGFYNVEIWEDDFERTAALLTEKMDHKLIAQQGNRYRYAASNTAGNYVDLLQASDKVRGLPGSGTVHHIAFNTPDAASQLEVRKRIAQSYLNPTPVLDRNYFTSIYFREPGGVLFEVATAGPGFTVDESLETLGTNLKLPAQYEPNRKTIENVIRPVTLNYNNYK